MEKFEDLQGAIITEIENKDDEEFILTLQNGEKYKLYHDQDCCERVSIEDICGDLNDLIGAPILLAEEIVSDRGYSEYDESSTWTFYKLATINGSVTIRWYGSSNGYYSEAVAFGPA